MFEITQVSIAPATRAAVSRILKARGIARDMDLIVEEALQAWLLKAACDDPPAAQAAARGYQWKSLFLPEGTLVRFSYRRKTYHAHVRGDELLYQGQAYSPRQLLLFVTGTVRNAWRELWLRSPGDARWHLADTRRHILRRTARGLHCRGVDLAPAGVTATEELPAPPERVPTEKMVQDTSAEAVPESQADIGAETAGGALPPPRIPRNIGRAAALRAILYRDDLVRPDQPDLMSRLGGGGHSKAGRAGPRDRRWISHLFNTR